MNVNLVRSLIEFGVPSSSSEALCGNFSGRISIDVNALELLPEATRNSELGTRNSELRTPFVNYYTKYPFPPVSFLPV